MATNRTHQKTRWTNIFARRSRPGQLTQTPRRRSRQLGCLEQLESRAMMTAIPVAVPFTEMTQIAEQFSAPEGPTGLYLNFDGNSEKDVDPFESTTGNRHQDMQEILFRVSQIFAPFNVEVQRLTGDGNFVDHGGATTIFIGDKLGNNVYAEGPNGVYMFNRTRAFADVDYPSPIRGILHRPNSDEYNDGFVDPVSFETGSAVNWAILNYQVGNNVSIARTIAHEAGHTFGLAHVLTRSTGSDLMSYDSPVRNSFENKSHETTDLNGRDAKPDPRLQPYWAYYQTVQGRRVPTPFPISTQNSFTYLNAVLGQRELSGDYANVADNSLVSPWHVDGDMPSVTLGYDSVASINRSGDYDVFELTVGATAPVKIDVASIATSDLDPVVMVFSNSGSRLLEFDNNGGHALDSQLVFQASAGTAYKVVVGANNGVSTGVYQLTVQPAIFQFNPWLGEFDELTSRVNPWTSQRPAREMSVVEDGARDYLFANDHLVGIRRDRTQRELPGRDGRRGGNVEMAWQVEEGEAGDPNDTALDLAFDEDERSHAGLGIYMKYEGVSGAS